MKRFPLFLLAGVISMTVIAPFAPNLLASIQPASTSPEWNDPAKNYPIGRDCVVTVDPLAGSTAQYAGDANVITGFAAPDTVRGVLIRIDEHWLVLRDGRSENWIPRHKVILLHVCV